jgi:hypothetical protein
LPVEQACVSTVTVSLPVPLHDRLIALANAHGVSVSEVVRRQLLRLGDGSAG